MSASLVGSEMCIRDRPPPHVVGHHRALGERAEDRLQLELLEGLALVVPVSYTHLTLPTICSV
eukprot:11272728-Alexandrium_andersonii.AAC.1